MAQDEVLETTAGTVETTDVPEAPDKVEDISYHAVEKDGSVESIWEMQGRRHLRTINPRSQEGKEILALFETAA